ncbi:hypothetical protein SLE2022_307330 [Rubroshorea leprosula]
MFQSTKMSNFSVDFDYRHFQANGSGLSSNEVVVIVIACLLVFLAFSWCLCERLMLLLSLYDPRRRPAANSHNRPVGLELSSWEGSGGSPIPAATSPSSHQAPLSPSGGWTTPAVASPTSHHAPGSPYGGNMPLDLEEFVVVDVV